MTEQESASTPLAAQVDRLRQLEIWLCMALALALHTSLTAAWVILIVGTVVTCVRPNVAGRLKMLLTAPLTMPLAVFALAVSVSTLANGGLSDARQIFPNVRSFLIYLYVYQAFASDQECKQKSLSVFLCVGALAGVYGTIQQIFNFHPFTYPYLQATGFLQAPMPFAGIMQMTSFLALGIFLRNGYTQLPHPINGKVAFLLVTACNFLGLLFSLERSAWLGMLAGILIITMRISPRALIRGALVCVVIVIFGWICVPAVRARVDALEHWQSDVSVSARLKIWKRSSDIFMEHPVLGVGPSHFPRITDIPEALVPGRSTDLNHAHSNYMQMLTTLGIVGLFSFLYLLIWSIKAALNGSLKTSFNGGISLGTFAAMVSLMVAGIFEYNFGAGQVKLAQWYMLGALENTLKS